MTILKSLCVYCGSSNRVDPVHRQAAATLGRILAENGVRLIYGGGRVGLMGICADAAMAGGGEVIGVIPEHLNNAEVGHTGLTELRIVQSMHFRKNMMFELADAFAILPGGLGTLDETFEIVTWRQLGLHDKPIVLVDNAGYWSPLLKLIDHTIAAGFARATTHQLFTVVERVEDVIPVIEAAPQPARVSASGRF
ncbi:MAG TPA: TIGR00730 family Rossman fold protein [Candidatus Cybelea sp.]|nr:TIGR00730 family Rossman fold protein [Candidatus Cybelea sp.]